MKMYNILHLDDNWLIIRRILGDDKYYEFRDRLYNKTTQNTSTTAFADFVHSIAVALTHAEKPDDIDLDYLLKNYDPNE